MKIAVTYEGGSIFQHFGKTETFKMYEVEDGKITSMQIVHAGGAGHSALAGFLSEQSANVLICGGIGEGAQEALKEAGIKVISGAAGEVDAAVPILQENWNLQVQIVTITTKKVIPAVDSMKKQQQKKLLLKKNIPVADTAVDAADVVAHMCRILKVRMSERPAVPITEVPLMMVPSLILPMTAESHWNLYAEPDR